MTTPEAIILSVDWLSSTNMLGIREKNKQLLAIHISWMANHKHMSDLCPQITNECDKRFIYDDESYFSSFHEVVCILRTIYENDRKPILSEIFLELDERKPYMVYWNNLVKIDHFEATEDSGETWPFWPIEFIYIASLDKLLMNRAFAKEYYRKDPLLYFGRCACKLCGHSWISEKKEKNKSKVISTEPIFVNGKKYLKSNNGEIYDAFTCKMIGKYDVVELISLIM
jgi:hypothetical protein